MYGREITPPPSGRRSILSSPDSVYKSSSDSSHNNLSFSPDSTAASTACKQVAAHLPKFRLDEDSDTECGWDPSMASPLPPKAPSVRRPNRTRSRISSAPYDACASPVPVQQDRSSSHHRMTSPVVTPPHKRLRALQLTDISNGSPHIARRRSPRATLFGGRKPAIRHSPIPPSAKKPTANPFTPNSFNRSVRLTPRDHCQSDSGFQDDSLLHSTGKHSDSENMDILEEKLALKEMSTSRYKEEFCEECVLGTGEFGTAFKCVNKLDGCTYAIKRSVEPVAGSAYEAMARNEVYAHAVLGKHSHVVRYYSAWAENGHLYIQNEYCNGGSLIEEIQTHQKRGTRFTETELKTILKQLAQGLKYIHGQQLVHLDIKPGNIFIQYNPALIQSPESGIEDDSDDGDESSDQITYKIGDLGHVTSVHASELEEGDCRYLPKEILHDDLKHLPKADIFALGLTIYQAATLQELPKNGDQWHAIREGRLPLMKGYSSSLNTLVKRMIHSDPSIRPAAAAILSHPDLCPIAMRSRKQLARELNEERFKNELLAMQLKAVQENVELKFTGLAAARSANRSSRLLGIKVNRSKSLTNF